MIESRMRKVAMAGALAAITTAGALAVTTTEAAAWCRGYGCNNGGAVAAGVIGGLAIGALAGAAAANAAPPPAPVYVAPGPGPVYVEDVEPGCYRAPRRVWIDGIGWRQRVVTVCE
ncbi:hypothetical protein [Chelatococcus reniformis]|uniref:DUF2510 domain-containing protein n=1 Tax=Chelatococcus reniformis TaxID=1494448 RepID=A0A916UGU0_9HYPH|nr:hypothetical protein [Chelatococcus reniformis]GGC72117.1 hypothetical protein GCM10010994_33180 [Chelatococcus reniformis]